MKTFKQYYKNKKQNLYLEFFDAIDGAVKHIDHLEENILNKGKQGVEDALNQIEASIKYFTEESDYKISVKFDGCIHPDTVLITEEGDMTIQQIINLDRPIKVLAHDHEAKQDRWVIAELPRINSNNKNWVEIELENGEIFKCTEDHEVYTENRGYVPAAELTSDDILKNIN
jgi:hypothetical protein